MFFLHFCCHLTICPTKPSTEKEMENAGEVLGSAGTGRAAVNMLDCYWIKIIMIDFDWIKLTLQIFLFLPAVGILGGLDDGSQPLAGMALGLKKKTKGQSA